MIPVTSAIEVKTRLDAQDLADLSAPGTGWRLSLFMPLEKSWTEIQDGAVLLRDLRRKAGEEMDSRGIGTAEKEALLAPVDAILDGAQGKVFHGKGLAILSAAGISKTVLLPAAPAASVQVDRHFALEPLLHGLSGRDRFYLLGLSLHSIQLWEGDGMSMKKIPLEGLDTNIKDALHFEDSDAPVRVQANRGSKGQGAAFYGVSGGYDDERKKEFATFFRKIDHGIAAKMERKDVPLILAGVGYLLPIYREVNTYAHLSPLEIPGKADIAGASEDLHDKASALLREAEREEVKKALATYKENLATGRTASGFGDVVPSACYKKLTHLFIRKGSKQWGAFTPGDGKTVLFDAFRPGAEDLVNLACARTLAARGKVYVLEGDEMPEGSEIAGLCRD